MLDCYHSRLSFGRDSGLRALQRLQVAVASDHGLSALLAHEVDRRLAHAVGQEHSAPELQDVGRAGGGEARVPARRDDQVCVGPMGPEGVLGEMGDPSVLERLRRMEVLRIYRCGVRHFDRLRRNLNRNERAPYF